MDRTGGLKRLVIPHPRSLRVRTALILVAVTLLPLIFVAVAGRLDWFSGERLLRTVRDASEQSAAVLTTSPRDEWDQELSAIARGQRMRIRVLDADGGVMLDLDHQEPGLVDEAMQPKRSEELRQLEELLDYEFKCVCAAAPAYENLLELLTAEVQQGLLTPYEASARLFKEVSREI